MAQYNILVVEDDSSLRKVVRDILELNAYRAYTAPNGQAALEILEWLRADLIISDIMMPVMDGYTFYRQIRSRPEWNHIPFIFLTAKGSKPDILVGKQLGVDDYLTKPFDADELLITMQSKLDIAGRWKQVQRQEVATIKRNILTALNHEFRTPLTYITAYSEILAESGGHLSRRDFDLFCQGILAGTQRLQSLVEDFLFLVQIETGEARIVLESRYALISDWAGFLQEVIEGHRPDAQKKRLSIQLHITGDPQPLVVDPLSLSDAIGRLLSNAIKFSAAGADPIMVTAGDSIGALHLAVRDYGVGIRPEALDGLFDVLYQVDRDKMEQQGSGSGLAIARSIVTLHGGEIRVESTPNLGSTFTIVLPVERRFTGSQNSDDSSA